MARPGQPKRVRAQRPEACWDTYAAFAMTAARPRTLGWLELLESLHATRASCRNPLHELTAADER